MKEELALLAQDKKWQEIVGWLIDGNQCSPEDVSELLNNENLDDDNRSTIAVGWLMLNPNCDYESFRKIAMRIGLDSDRTPMVVDRVNAIPDANKRYDLLLKATKDNLTYNYSYANSIPEIAHSYQQCTLPNNQIGNFCKNLYPTSEDLQTKLFIKIVTQQNFSSDAELLEVTKNFTSTLAVDSNFRQVLEEQKIKDALTRNNVAENDLHRSRMQIRNKFLFALLGEDLATFTHRNAVSSSEAGQLPEHELTQIDKFRKVEGAIYASSHEMRMYRTAAGKEWNYEFPLPKMGELTAYLRNKVGKIPPLNPDKIDTYEINFENPLLLKKRAEINEEFVELLRANPSDLTKEKVANFFERSWSSDKKNSAEEQENFREFLVSKRNEMALLFQTPEEFHLFMEKCSEGLEVGKAYLEEKVPTAPAPKVESYQINFEDPKILQTRAEINEKFRALLKYKGDKNESEFQDSVLNFFTTSLGVEIDPNQKLKLADFFLNQRSEMAYLFEKQDKFDCFMRGCVATLESGCVANIGTQARVSIAASLITNPTAQIIYSIFSNKICTQLLNSGSQDALGSNASGQDPLRSDVINSSYISPAGFIKAVTNEFRSEDGRSIRDPWEFIEKTSGGLEVRNSLYSTVEKMAETATKDSRERLEGLLKQSSNGISEITKKILDRNTTREERDELRKQKKELEETFAKNPEEKERQEKLAQEIKLLKNEIEEKKIEMIRSAAVKIATYVTLQKSLPEILEGSDLKEEVEEICRNAQPPIVVEPAKKIVSLRPRPPSTLPPVSMIRARDLSRSGEALMQLPLGDLNFQNVNREDVAALEVLLSDAPSTSMRPNLSTFRVTSVTQLSSSNNRGGNGNGGI